jgi:hypothetical protein
MLVLLGVAGLSADIVAIAGRITNSTAMEK